MNLRINQFQAKAKRGSNSARLSPPQLGFAENQQKSDRDGLRRHKPYVLI